jgi:hypothetical protein
VPSRDELDVPLAELVDYALRTLAGVEQRATRAQERRDVAVSSSLELSAVDADVDDIAVDDVVDLLATLPRPLSHRTYLCLVVFDIMC